MHSWLQSAIKNLLAEVNRIKAEAEGFLGAASKLSSSIEKILKKAVNLVSQAAKVTIDNARGYVVNKLNAGVSDLINLLPPNQRSNASDKAENAIDTLIIARKAFPGAKVNLDALCRRFKVDNSSRQYHGALKDAELLAEVYVELTGGRQTSFVIKNESKGFNSDKDLSVDTLGNKIVIRPTKEEQIFHKEFLQKIFN